MINCQTYRKIKKYIKCLNYFINQKEDMDVLIDPRQEKLIVNPETLYLKKKIKLFTIYKLLVILKLAIINSI